MNKSDYYRKWKTPEGKLLLYNLSLKNKQDHLNRPNYRLKQPPKINPFGKPFQNNI